MQKAAGRPALISVCVEAGTGRSELVLAFRDDRDRDHLRVVLSARQKERICLTSAFNHFSMVHRVRSMGSVRVHLKIECIENGCSFLFDSLAVLRSHGHIRTHDSGGCPWSTD